MPDRPDYAALTRGQIAILGRVDSGDAGLDVLEQLVRLAEETLGAGGAGFAEYASDHGRIIAATGVCAPALGRRTRQLLIGPVRDEFAGLIEGDDARYTLGTRCASGGTVFGSLHVYFDAEPGHEHVTVLELLAAFIGRVYRLRAGLPTHGEPAPEEVRRDADRDLWVAVTSH
ncbi:MAG TPA: sensor histidine kinase, partial [Actinoplanes sp.]|nr:sensor histidine kinase [Actinoplanes sp.]